MRHSKTTVLMIASLVLVMFLGLAGCGDDHRTRYSGDRDRYPERYDRHDGDRHVDRDRDSDRRYR